MAYYGPYACQQCHNAPSDEEWGICVDCEMENDGIAFCADCGVETDGQAVCDACFAMYEGDAEPRLKVWVCECGVTVV